MHIVVNDKNFALCLREIDKGTPKVLLQSDTVTIFNSYSAARNAIKQSRKYAIKHSYDDFWKTKLWKIRRCEAQS
jgi:hypothetical protein